MAETTAATLYYARNVAEFKRAHGCTNIRILKRGKRYVIKYDEPKR